MSDCSSLPGYADNVGKITCHGDYYTCADDFYLQAGLCTPCADFCAVSALLPGSCKSEVQVSASSTAVYVMFDVNPLCTAVAKELFMDFGGFGGSGGSADLTPTEEEKEEEEEKEKEEEEKEKEEEEKEKEEEIKKEEEEIKKEEEQKKEEELAKEEQAAATPPPPPPAPTAKGNDVVTLQLSFAVDSNAYNPGTLRQLLVKQFSAVAATVTVTLGPFVPSRRHLLAPGTVSSTVALTGANGAAALALAQSPSFASALSAAGVTGVTASLVSPPPPPNGLAAESGQVNSDLLALLVLLIIPVTVAAYFGYEYYNKKKAANAAVQEPLVTTADQPTVTVTEYKY